MSFDEILNALAGIIKKIAEVDPEIARLLRSSIVLDFKNETIKFTGDKSILIDILEHSLIIEG